MKKLLLLSVFFPILFFSQEFDRIGARFAYTHTNKSHNFGFGGISFNTEVDYAGASLYAGTHFGTKNSKFKIIPEIGAEIYFVTAGAGLSLNTESIQPRVGITIINIIQTHFGYAVPFSKNSAFKGFTFTAVFNIYTNKK